MQSNLGFAVLVLTSQFQQKYLIWELMRDWLGINNWLMTADKEENGPVKSENNGWWMFALKSVLGARHLCCCSINCPDISLD